ncbi:MAG: exodeoxyribonuclease VII large subunit [Eubacteriales bacterium]
MSVDFLTVSQINGYIKTLFESDDVLCGVSVAGEISNIKFHSSGHVYLTLKDEDSTLSAVMFRSDFARISFRPENGMRVIASGRIGVYERSGQYQLYISYMRPDGIGELYMRLEQLKKKLAAEGLFDESRKMPIPKFPKRIGVVTSPTGAVIRDILKVTGRRYPLADIVLYPVHVQGNMAIGEICTAIDYFNIEKCVDVLIVGRGGGSAEDLWAFNSEEIARAIARSEIPVISAVGHQTDFTLCDMVADRTASTPSVAAEFAVPDRAELEKSLCERLAAMTGNISGRIRSERIFIDGKQDKLDLNSPGNRLARMCAELDSYKKSLDAAAGAIFSARREAFARSTAKLSALNPLAVLARGYGYVRAHDGDTVTSAGALKKGDPISITFCDGEVSASVTGVRHDLKGT